MKMVTFVGFFLCLALAIWGRRLRENAFRSLSNEQTAAVIDKLPNYTSTEMIPFAGAPSGFSWRSGGGSSIPDIDALVACASSGD